MRFILKDRYQFIFATLVFLEIVLFTILRGKLGYYFSPLALFVASTAIVALPIYLLQSKKAMVSIVNQRTGLDYNWLGPTLLVLVLILFYVPLSSFLESRPVNAKYSDVIPAIQIMVERFLSGGDPYDVIKFHGYDVNPSYFTMHWLPFSIAQKLNIDYRAFAYILLAISILIIGFHVRNKQSRFTQIAVVVCVASILILTLGRSGIFNLTIEVMIAAYYLFLCFAISSRKQHVLLVSIAILLCLLSRYSLVFWLPVFAIVLFKDHKKQLFQIIGLVFIGVLFLYIIPFLLKDPSNLFSHFGKAADEWYPKVWDINGKPRPLFSGVGFACYFYSFFPGSLELKIKACQLFHVFACLSVMVFSIWFYYKRFAYFKSVPLYLLLSLKFNLIFFYYFIHVPYIYLNAVHIFISIALLALIRIESEKDDIEISSVN